MTHEVTTAAVGARRASGVDAEPGCRPVRTAPVPPLANGKRTSPGLVVAAPFVALMCAALLTAGAHAARAGGVVGTGTPDSCTEAAFDAAASGGGLVTFNCGGPATITFTSQKQVQNNSNLTVDGGGVITISGGSSVNIAIVVLPR